MSEVSSQWQEVEHLLVERFGKIPDMEGILYLIGINELGSIPIEDQKFSKEQKQDLMHIGVCRVLEGLGYYEFDGRDDDGWPHYRLLKNPEHEGVMMQEFLLKKGVIQYLLS